MRSWDDPYVINILAGGIAGAATAVFVCPLDVLKTRMQVQTIKAGEERYSLRGGCTYDARALGKHCRSRAHLPLKQQAFLPPSE